MSGFVIHRINPGVTVRVVRSMPPLPEALERRVDHLWSAAAARVEAGGAGRLFNGRVFSAETIAADAITGHMTEYRRLVAQMEDHALFGELGIRSLSVGGVLRCADGVVIGRRPAAAIYQPGMWQLPPAGSVDAGALRADGTLDLRTQLLTELREETGLAATDVSAPLPLCAVEHAGSHVTDLGMALTSGLSGAAIQAIHCEAGNTEYDPLLVVGEADIPAFVSRHGAAVTPQAIEFLFRAGLLSVGL